MAVPRNRLSNSRKNTKRSHHAKKPQCVTNCANCSGPRMPHTICQSCGHYGDRLIVAKN